jgi:hypothetical protein
MKPLQTLLVTAKLALECSSKIHSVAPDKFHALISCSKSKGGHREVARHMYNSPLYREPVILAERRGIPFSILSVELIFIIRCLLT